MAKTLFDYNAKVYKKKKTAKAKRRKGETTRKVKPGYVNRKYNKPKRKASKKKTSNYQTGSSNKAYDRHMTAKRPGKRKSKSGNTYYERRANRSDKSKKTRL